MSSHLDNARKELTAQRRLLSSEISQLNRQLKKIDQALDHLAPVNGAVVTRNRPTAQEATRRNDILSTFYLDRVKQHKDHATTLDFDVDDFLDHTQEPQELRKVYQSLIIHSKHIFHNVPGKRGLYRVILPS